MAIEYVIKDNMSMSDTIYTMAGLEVSKMSYLPNSQNDALFRSGYREYRRKLHTNPLAQLVVLLAPGHLPMEYVEPWMVISPISVSFKERLYLAIVVKKGSNL